MEILSKDTMALLGNEKIRQALDELLKENGTEKVVAVSKAKSDKSEQDSEEVRVVTLRRLSA